MKHLLLSAFEFYIQSSIHVALAVVSLLCVFTFSEEISMDKNLVFTLFFGTITGYNFVKYATIAKLYHRSLARSLKIIRFFSFVCFVLMCFFGTQLPYNTLLTFGVVGGITFLYAVPLMTSKNVRSIAGLKIYIVALCWVFAVVIIPAIHYDLDLNKIVFIKAIQVLCLVIALIIPFDIRDLAYDTRDLKTIPQQLGTPVAKGIALMLLFVFYIIEIYLTGVMGSLLVLPVCLVTGVLIWIMPLQPSKYYCSFWLESIPVFYGLVIASQFV